MNRKGFTLVELLVVIAIIAILSIVVSSSLMRSRDEAKAVVCKSQLKDLGTRFTQETLDLYNVGSSGGGSNDGYETIELPCGCKIRLPTDSSPIEFPVKLEGCPKAPVNPLYAELGGDEPKTLSYGAVDLTAIDMDELEEHERWLIACSDLPTISEFDELAFDRHRGSVNVFFYDGHVDRVPREYMPFPGREKPDEED